MYHCDKFICDLEKDNVTTGILLFFTPLPLTKKLGNESYRS